MRWSAQLLEWDDLKALIGRYIAGPLGRAQLEALEPSSDRAWIWSCSTQLPATSKV